jgi:hypothetical protein
VSALSENLTNQTELNVWLVSRISVLEFLVAGLLSQSISAAKTPEDVNVQIEAIRQSAKALRCPHEEPRAVALAYLEDLLDRSARAIQSSRRVSTSPDSLQ